MGTRPDTHTGTLFIYLVIYLYCIHCAKLLMDTLLITHKST